MADEKVDKSKLIAYVTGDLEEYEKLKLRRLIEADAELRREIELLTDSSKGLKDYYKEKGDLGLSPEQLEKIRMSAAQSTKPPSKKKFVAPIWWYGVGGGLATAAVLTLVILNTDREVGVEVPPPKSSQNLAPPPVLAPAEPTAPPMEVARAEKSEDLDAALTEGAPKAKAKAVAGAAPKPAFKGVRRVPDPPQIGGLSNKTATYGAAANNALVDDAPTYDRVTPDAQLFAHDLAPLTDAPPPTGAAAARLRKAGDVSRQFYTVQVFKHDVTVTGNLDRQKIAQHIYTRLQNNRTCFSKSIPKDEAELDLRLILTVARNGQIQTLEVRPKIGKAVEISKCLSETLQNSVAFIFSKGEVATVTAPIKLQ